MSMKNILSLYSSQDYSSQTLMLNDFRYLYFLVNAGQSKFFSILSTKRHLFSPLGSNTDIMVSCAYYPLHYMHCIIFLGNNETMIARGFSYPVGKMYWGDLVPCISQNSRLISQLNIVIRLIQRRKKVFTLNFQQSTTIRKIIHTLMPDPVSLLLIVCYKVTDI